MDGLFVIPFGPLILKTVSPLDPHSLTARRNPVLKKHLKNMFAKVHQQLPGANELRMLIWKPAALVTYCNLYSGFRHLQTPSIDSLFLIAIT